MQACAVKRFAIDNGFEFFQPATLKSSEVQARLAAIKPDAMIVAAYGLLLPQQILDVPKHGALNIHGSLLPRWRGAAPIQRAILAGDRETGVSIMKMDAGLDTGPVLARRSIAIAENDDAGTLRDKLAAMGAEMMVETLERIEAGDIRSEPQLSSGATYARKIEKDETMLDWGKPAVEIERAVRAYRPSPGAATRLQGEILKIWQAHVCHERGMPGQVLCASDGGLVIGCGKQSLEISELQRQGGRRMSAREFLRGHAIVPGAQFT